MVCLSLSLLTGREPPPLSLVCVCACVCRRYDAEDETARKAQKARDAHRRERSPSHRLPFFRSASSHLPLHACPLQAREALGESERVALERKELLEKGAARRQSLREHLDAREAAAKAREDGRAAAGTSSSAAAGGGPSSVENQAARVRGAHGEIHETVQALHERGEKLQNLNERMDAMNHEAEDFFAQARKLRMQAEKNSRWLPF